MAFIFYSSIQSKWHPSRFRYWWKLFSFDIIRRFFFGYGTDHYFLEGVGNPEKQSVCKFKKAEINWVQAY